MRCDICNNISKQDNSYLLTTLQVVCSIEYWKYWLSLAESQSPGRAKRHPLKFLAVVKQLCESQSAWIVCSDCIQYFDVDLEEAKRWLEDILRKDPKALIPESGDADLSIALLAASSAWKDKFGSNLVELIKTELAELPEGGNRMLFSEEIGTQRKHFWQFFKRHFD